MSDCTLAFLTHRVQHRVLDSLEGSGLKRLYTAAVLGLWASLPGLMTRLAGGP